MQADEQSEQQAAEAADTPAACPSDVPPDQEGPREPVELRVAYTMAGMRIDMFLAQALHERSRSFYQRCIRDGYARLNGGSCRPADRVRTNDLVNLEWPPERRLALVAEDIPFEVVMEDADVLVICKPAGLVVHPARGHWTGTLVHGLLAHDEESFSALADDEMRPGIVHRLDRDTSGLLVVAKHDRAHRALAAQFQAHTVYRRYLALVHGGARMVDGGTFRTLYGRHPTDRKRFSSKVPAGKDAVTHWRTLLSGEGVHLVEVCLETGRTHQIRVHLADCGHPVVGDSVYGGRRRTAHAALERLERQALHAYALGFEHPAGSQPVTFREPPPPDLAAALVGVWGDAAVVEALAPLLAPIDREWTTP